MAKLPEFAMQNLTNTAWAYAALGFRNKPLLEAVAEQTLGNRSELIPQDASRARRCAISLASRARWPEMFSFGRHATGKIWFQESCLFSELGPYLSSGEPLK